MRERVGICLEMLARAGDPLALFVNAHATMHTAGQSYIMAFAGCGANALDRGVALRRRVAEVYGGHRHRRRTVGRLFDVGCQPGNGDVVQGHPGSGEVRAVLARHAVIGAIHEDILSLHGAAFAHRKALITEVEEAHLAHSDVRAADINAIDQHGGTGEESRP